jgi:hypothetical protein
MLRFLFALVASLSLAVAARAADLPTGTWAANVDDNKGELVIKEVKAGKVTGTLFGTDFSGSLNGKELTFEIGKDSYEARLVSEPAEGGKTKYTLTGTRSQSTKVQSRLAVHVVKTGWYAQLTTDTPVPQGDIKAEVRGVLVYDGETAYVSVKRKGEDEVRVWLLVPETDGKALQKSFSELKDKEVIVSGKLSLFKGPKPADRFSRRPDPAAPGALSMSAPFELKAAK